MKARKIIESAKIFWKKNTRGGVTVFICLVLIPVMMFTGLMIDIARIKLYHSEAAGAANSYADAVLSQYDELLYNVYGLLSVTQDENGLQALEVIKEYMQSSYDPASMGKATNASESSLKYVPENIVFIGKNNDKLNTSWAPYGNTKMSLDGVVDKSGSGGANLANKAVFADQVCDYMKIIGPVDLAWNGLTEAIDSGSKTKENAELMNDRKDVDKLYNHLDGKLKNLYGAINNLNSLDVWEVPNEAVAYVSGDNNITARYNMIYSNFISLSCGPGSKIGQIYSSAVTELQNDEDGVVYDRWVSEIGGGSVSDNNYLYDLCCIRAAIEAEDPSELNNASYTNPVTGTTYALGNIRLEYDGPNRAFKIYIDQYQNEMNEFFNDWRSRLSEDSKDSNTFFIRYCLNSVVTILGGGSSLIGTQTEGINSVAAEAENKRSAFVEKCSDKPRNEMAQGLAKEYSFSDEGAEEMKFVGEFDYDWLKGKYQKNFDFLNKLNGYLEDEQYTLNVKFNQLRKRIFGAPSSTVYLTAYLDDRIALLETYGSTGFSDWSFDRSGEDLEIDRRGMIFSSIDNVKHMLEAAPNPVEWFDIRSSAIEINDPKHDFKKLWSILEKWYSSGGSSEKSEAKTTEYKNLLKELKKSLADRGDAGKELLNQFENINIPNFINTSSKEQTEQSVTSLFGDEGDFNTTIKTEGIQKNADYYITKLLMMDYDWNFFAGATFGKQSGGADKNKLNGKTLKGEAINEKTNYLVRNIGGDLCGAELEYIYWGNKNAKTNLSAVRNQIMVIRAVENFASTYSISKINMAITDIKIALAPIPIAALIVPPLLRSAIAMAETHMDLQELYEGKSIVLYKTELSHLTLLNDKDLKDTLNKMFAKDGKTSPLQKSSFSDDPIMFNYNQYVVLVTMLFCDTSTIIERTQDLVELNINHRLGVNFSKIENVFPFWPGADLLKKESDLPFRLENASVAVRSTCKIDRMDLLILGGVFNQESVDGYLSEDKLEVLKDGFSYTVYRSY